MAKAKSGEGIDREWLARAMHECWMHAQSPLAIVTAWKDLPTRQRERYRETAKILAPLLERKVWENTRIDLGAV